MPCPLLPALAGPAGFRDPRHEAGAPAEEPGWPCGVRRGSPGSPALSPPAPGPAPAPPRRAVGRGRAGAAGGGVGMAQPAEASGHTATASMDNNVLAIVIAASEWRAGAPQVPGAERGRDRPLAGASRAVPLRRSLRRSGPAAACPAAGVPRGLGPERCREGWQGRRGLAVLVGSVGGPGDRSPRAPGKRR